MHEPQLWHRFAEARDKARLTVILHYIYVEVLRGPKGAWIRPVNGGPKYFMRDSASTRLAQPSEREALIDFLARKKVHRQKLVDQIEIVDRLVKQAKELLDGKNV